MRSQALERASQRIVWMRLAGLAVVLVLAGRAAHLTVAHDRARHLFESQIRTEQQLAPARGTIFDRDGRELAITTVTESVYALPGLVEDPAATARALATALDLDTDHIARRLAANDRFTYVARWVDRAAAERVRALEIPGIGIDREPRRSYPAGKLAAPLIGFANIDGQGVRAIEQMEDEWLKGRPRRVRVERDARGRALALQSTDPRDVQGGDVALSIDAAMQGAAEAALHEAVEAHDARGGLVITLDPKNGDILALAEAPGFDPNHFRELDYESTRAHSFTDAVEAGSTMKAFLVATALEEGAIRPDQTFDTGEGSIRVRGKTIHDHEPYGVLGPAGVLRVSSNVGAVQIAQALGRDAQHRGLLRFGFGRSTGSGYPMESVGLVRDWRGWQPVDQATIAFGQGVSVTAIQLASALAALGNEGVRMRPRAVVARRRTGEPWQATGIESAGRAVSPEVAQRTLDMMRSVVSAEGTGRLAHLADVAVAGKTGTAQKLDRERGRYSNRRYIAWFMGVVPADDPELAIVVAIDEPGGYPRSGGWVAAPVFARVAAAQLARRGIVTEPDPLPEPEREPEPETRLVETSPTVAPPEPRAAAVTTPMRPTPSRAVPATALAAAPSPPAPIPTRIPNATPPTPAVAAPPPRPAALVAAGPPGPLAREVAFVPDFLGQTIDRARRLAAGESLRITFSGAIEGRVVSQLPVPGTVLEGEDRTVRLRFAARREEG
jgi:cell division protein FtsI (penicillin-binding protein 3)